MTHAMVLKVSQSRGDRGTRRTLTLTHVSDPRRRDREIFYDLIGDVSAPEPRLLDGFVLAIIFYAMRLGQDIDVRGALSRDFVRNLSEFQDAWASWKPDTYRKINVAADELVAHMDARDDAIAAFSGGIDSIFTVLRHSDNRLGPGRYPLKSVLTVHGFDVPLNKPEHFDALKERTFPLIADLGVEFLTLATNSRELNLQDWEDSYLAQLAACLHNYDHQFGYGLVGSSAPYYALTLPWGSNPATDHLFSGAAMRLVHDGAAYSRAQKVGELVKYPTASRVAKVCWEGKESFKNCGKCEKCVRTLLCFKAAGVTHPACFDAPLDEAQINSVNLRNNLQFEELRCILAQATARGVRAKWIDELEVRIQRYENARQPRHLRPRAFNLRRIFGARVFPER